MHMALGRAGWLYMRCLPPTTGRGQRHLMLSTGTLRCAVLCWLPCVRVFVWVRAHGG